LFGDKTANVWCLGVALKALHFEGPLSQCQVGMRVEQVGSSERAETDGWGRVGVVPGGHLVGIFFSFFFRLGGWRGRHASFLCMRIGVK
jgi:hypothetical protein